MMFNGGRGSTLKYEKDSFFYKYKYIYIERESQRERERERERAAVSEQYKSAFAVVISTELSITHYYRSGQKTGNLQ